MKKVGQIKKGDIISIEIVRRYSTDEVALANACKIPIERVNMEYFIEKCANGK